MGRLQPLLSMAQGAQKEEELSSSAVSANQFSLFSWHVLKMTKVVLIFLQRPSPAIK